MTRDCLRRTANRSNRVTAVVVYEDLVTDVRASEFCGAVSKHLGPKIEITRLMWLLNELRLPRLCAIAAGDASLADLLIVSLHHTETVPQGLKAWVEQWLGKGTHRPILLLALLDSAHSGISATLRAYLHSVADAAHMEFLVQAEESSEDA